MNRLERVIEEAGALDQRRQAQIQLQVASINRLLVGHGVLEPGAATKEIARLNEQLAALPSEWADYIERWGSEIGHPQFTQEAVVKALRGPTPFGTGVAQ